MGNFEAVNSQTFKNWDDMKNAHKGEVTKFAKDNKPYRSPDIKKWFNKGGSIAIETLEDGTQIWKYTNKSGKMVPYVLAEIGDKSYHIPDFSDHLHPNKKIASVNMGNLTGDRNSDTKAFLQLVGLDKIPNGYKLHHGIPEGVMQLVKSDIHEEFTHIGGSSIYSK